MRGSPGSDARPPRATDGSIPTVTSALGLVAFFFLLPSNGVQARNRFSQNTYPLALACFSSKPTEVRQIPPALGWSPTASSARSMTLHGDASRAWNTLVMPDSRGNELVMPPTQQTETENSSLLMFIDCGKF